MVVTAHFDPTGKAREQNRLLELVPEPIGPAHEAASHVALIRAGISEKRSLSSKRPTVRPLCRDVPEAVREPDRAATASPAVRSWRSMRKRRNVGRSQGHSRRFGDVRDTSSSPNSRCSSIVSACPKSCADGRHRRLGMKEAAN